MNKFKTNAGRRRHKRQCRDNLLDIGGTQRCEMLKHLKDTSSHKISCSFCKVQDDVNAVDQPPSRHPDENQDLSILIDNRSGVMRNNKQKDICKKITDLQSLKIDSDFRQNDVKAAAFTLAEGAAHANISAKFGRCAFTLAEVLISLGIIGIVAAMTIPTIIQNYQERAWNKSAEVFERKLEAALQVMNTQEVLAGYNNTKDFVTELGNHFKITKICDTPTDCFEDTVYFGAGDADPEEVDMTVIKTAKNFGQDDWDTEALGIQFANGTNGVIAYNPDCTQDPYSNQITGTSCIALLYDTTGYSTPNTSGKDLRSINVNKLGSACAFEIGSTCYGSPFTPTPLTYAECMEVKDDLGLTYCYNGNDYFAGAAAACGGVDKMPTGAQLGELADYLYNTSGIGTSYKSGLTLDTDKASALGFTLDSSNCFSVWSGQEASEAHAYHRLFYSTYTNWYDRYRGDSSRQAVCLGD